MRKILLAAAALLCACRSEAQPQAPIPTGAPKLMIVISVDQFSAELWNEYRPEFTGGLARLGSGVVFRNGFESHAATETCPGHSTILTGDRPARTGIIVNSWVDQSAARADKTIYCAEDETVPGSSSSNYTVSPRQLKVPTLGELLKARSPSSRSVAVAGKDRAAVMMGGHRLDQRWYWRRTGFTTDLAGVATPVTVTRVNAAFAAALAQPRLPLDPPPVCAAKAQTYTIGKGKIVGNGRFARAANDVSAAEDSPEFDGAVLALAAGLTQELGLGRGTAPDLLAVGLSATDYVGHSFGTQGQEMCLQLLSLDRDLGDFFAMLDSRGIDYAVALTADHAGFDIPERVPGGSWVDPSLNADTVGKAIGAKLGLSGPVLLGGGYSGDIFIDRGLSPTDRAKVREEAMKSYRSHPQVEAVFTREQIAATPLAITTPDRWTLLERLRASFDPVRSGDLLVVLKPKVAPYPKEFGIASTHGTPWDYDRRVPIVFWRPNIAATTRDDPVETVDIMPTLAAMIGVPLSPGAVDGKCLPGVTVCPVAGAVAAERGKR